MTKVGFIGAGDMGRGMAINLLQKGFDLTVVGHVRLDTVNELVAMGARRAESAKQLAAVSEVIFSVVRDDAQTEHVMWGSDGVLAGANAGSTIVVSSTVSPSLCQRLAADAAARGVGVIDAPVSGTRLRSETGMLTMMIGGDEAIVKKVEPVLAAVSANRFHLGKVGMGQIGKLANNMLAILNMAGVTEAMLFATQAGIPVNTFLSLVNLSTGQSWASQNWDLVHTLKQDRSPNAQLWMVTKDLDLALSAAKEVGTDVPLITALRAVDQWRKTPEPI